MFVIVLISPNHCHPIVNDDERQMMKDAQAVKVVHLNIIVVVDAVVVNVYCEFVVVVFVWLYDDDVSVVVVVADCVVCCQKVYVV